ncbi:MAG: hypothetical protein M3680_00575 [Myxococcota bacterium]|nr:hypothetical protein [Myxococcota bacterium]
MLSGDLFDPRDVDDKGAPVHDSLFKLAKKPSSDPGKALGTQDEIIYAIYKENPKDIRFNPICTKEQPSGGPWALYPRMFSDEVKDTVDARYLRLATRNRDHFSHPDEKQKGIGGPRDSNLGGYRALHQDAIVRAYQAGRAGQNAGEALAREAAAQHFLTDAFSSGHIRTPRASMQQYWNARYPRFPQGIQQVFIEGIQTALSSQPAGGIMPAVSDAVLMWVVGKQVRSMFGSVNLSFGDIISKVAHDLDNDEGVWVVNDANMRWKAFGDGQMYKKDPDNKTPEITRLAVSLGVNDIDTSYTLGAIDAGQAERKPEVLLADVMAHARAPAAPGVKFAPEQLIPRADPNQVAANGTLNWTASSFEDLWNLPVRTDKAQTYGNLITEALRPKGEFYEMLIGKKGGIAESEAGFRPRDAYVEFLTRLQADPRFWMYYILERSS